MRTYCADVVLYNDVAAMRETYGDHDISGRYWHGDIWVRRDGRWALLVEQEVWLREPATATAEAELRATMEQCRRASLEGDTEKVASCLAEEYRQTDISGYVQDKTTWLNEYFKPLAELITAGKFISDRSDGWVDHLWPYHLIGAEQNSVAAHSVHGFAQHAVQQLLANQPVHRGRIEIHVFVCPEHVECVIVKRPSHVHNDNFQFGEADR
jgi:hypothetical protein